MASTSSTPDFTRKSCGSSFEEKSNGVTDLSDLARGVFSGQSMAGGNVVTNKDPRVSGAAGTASEQTAVNLETAPLNAQGVNDLFASPNSDSEIDTTVHGGGRRGGEPGNPFGSNY
jgi:hypothetical protein